MPSTYVVGMGRLTFPYTINGFLHKSRLYARNVQAVSGSYNVNSRTVDANDQVWTDAAAGMEYAISGLLPSAASYGDFLLEKWDGSLWIPLATATITPTNKTGGTAIAGQITVTFRDTTLKKLKVVIEEGNETYPQRFASPTGGDAAFDAMIAEFLSTHTQAHAPYVWAVSHRGTYLNTSPFVSASVWLNQKIGRRRGL